MPDALQSVEINTPGVQLGGETMTPFREMSFHMTKSPSVAILARFEVFFDSRQDYNRGIVRQKILREPTKAME